LKYQPSDDFNGDTYESSSKFFGTIFSDEAMVGFSKTLRHGFDMFSLFAANFAIFFSIDMIIEIVSDIHHPLIRKSWIFQ